VTESKIGKGCVIGSDVIVSKKTISDEQKLYVFNKQKFG
jgi:hypothetical protein